MIMHSQTILTTLPPLLLLLLPITTAQSVPSKQGHSNVQENFLYSCLELDCPFNDSDANSREVVCRLDNQTLDAVGMAQTAAEEVVPGANFTWTVGNTNYFQVNESQIGQMSFERVFYMGKQFEVEDDTHGCAFYMVKEHNNENIFPPPEQTADVDDPSYFVPDRDPSMCRTTYLLGKDSEDLGSCTAALSDLFRVATANVTNSNTTSSFTSTTCQQIADFAFANLATANVAGCTIATEGEDKAVIRGYPITGPDAAKPLEARDTECYPTSPRTNELTRVFAYNITLKSADSFLVRNGMDGETPVWTGYWKGAGGNGTDWTDGMVDKKDVWLDMVCLRPRFMNKRSAEAMDAGKNEALRIGGSQMRAVMGVVAAVVAASWLL